jgi:crossover junction endodeoxyribonuclease RuvC
MEERYFCGVDIGQKGGFAFFDSLGEPVEAVKMPLVKVGKGSKKAYDETALYALFEKAMPGQGVTSMFSLGAGYGLIRGILVGMQLPYQLVRSQQWKGDVLKGTAKDKTAAIVHCKQTFPTLSLVPPKGRVDHDGIADAVCIGEYCWRYWRAGD